jgi:LysM domain
VVPESRSPSPDDVDQGSSPDTPLPYEVDPVLTDPQGDAAEGGPGASPGGGSADESDESGPIEAEPVDDPDAGLQLTDPAVPGDLDSGALPVSPTTPAPSTGPPAGPDTRAPAPEGESLAPSPEGPSGATWHATARKPHVLSERRSGKLRSPAEALPGASEPAAPEAPLAVTEPAATETPAVATEPVAGAVSVAAPLGRGRFHVVRRGDSLWSIASRLLDPDASDSAVALEVRRLWRLNAERIGTGDPNLLRVGVKLRLR